VSFGEFFLVMLIWVPLIMLWIFALTDLARRVDISGLAKGLWAVAIVLLPVVGMVIYFIARPHDAEMEKEPDVRMAEIMAETNAGFSGGTLAQLERLGDLKDAGAITDEEFDKLKAQLLG
jgi:membrane protein implicated in regulation of membrane protease activity